MYQDVTLFHIDLYQQTETKDMPYGLYFNGSLSASVYRYLIKGTNIMSGCTNLPLFLVIFFEIYGSMNVLLLKKIQFSLTCNK